MILKEELSDIVQAEERTNKEVARRIEAIGKQTKELEEHLYLEFKAAKQHHENQLQEAIAKLKEDIHSEFAQKKMQMMDTIEQEYEQLQIKKAPVVQLIVDEFWQLPKD